MHAEPLSFGARFSVHLWSAALQGEWQPAFAVVNYAGLSLYSWSVQPELLCHFGFGGFRPVGAMAAESTAAEEAPQRLCSGRPLLLGWQTVEHVPARDGSRVGKWRHTKRAR